jgi:exodeoxyribonuclease V alpha subunit
MTGKVLSIEYESENFSGSACCRVQFDDIDEVLFLTRENCWEIGLQLAYLITIHKSQGSEYNECAIIIDSKRLERSGIYTALTRTKKLCILIGTNMQYNAAIMRPPSYKSIQSGFAPVFNINTEPKVSTCRF